MVIKNVNLEVVCGVTSKVPDNPYYEVAFAGKSNVGKSSLINTLMNRKALARISSQPGKTQTINFYNINNLMYLVDLPGYGYANANVEIKAQWGKMIENYLHVSRKLKAVFLLIDIRHQPSENDVLMYDWMVSQGFVPVIIATKLDKIKRSQVKSHIQMIEETLHVVPKTVIIPFSAETKQGRDEIWELIDSLVLPLEEVQTKEMQAKKVQAEELQVETDAIQNMNDVQNDGTKQKKARWKAAGKAVAKKTAKKREKKRIAHIEEAKKAAKRKNRERFEQQKRETIKRKDKKQGNMDNKKDLGLWK